MIKFFKIIKKALSLSFKYFFWTGFYTSLLYLFCKLILWENIQAITHVVSPLNFFVSVDLIQAFEVQSAIAHFIAIIHCVPISVIVIYIYIRPGLYFFQAAYLDRFVLTGSLSFYFFSILWVLKGCPILWECISEFILEENLNVELIIDGKNYINFIKKTYIYFISFIFVLYISVQIPVSMSFIPFYILRLISFSIIFVGLTLIGVINIMIKYIIFKLVFIMIIALFFFTEIHQWYLAYRLPKPYENIFKVLYKKPGIHKRWFYIQEKWINYIRYKT